MLKYALDNFQELTPNNTSILPLKVYAGSFPEKKKNTSPDMNFSMIGSLNSYFKDVSLIIKVLFKLSTEKLDRKVNFYFVGCGNELKTMSKIKSYEGIDFLNQSLSNLDTERKSIESRLTQIENQNLNSLDIEAKISRLTQDITKLEGQIETYSNLLIHQISKDARNKELLNAIFSDSITALPKENIQSSIEKLTDVMKIFDGAITIPKDFKGKPIASIDDLRIRKDEAVKEKVSNEQLLPIAKDLEKYRSELLTVQQKIKEVNGKIEELNSLPELKKNLTIEEGEQKVLIQQKDETEKELRITEETIGRINQAIEILAKDILQKESRISKIQEWKVKIEESGIKHIEYHTNESLDNLFKNFERNSIEREDSKNKKERLFETLKVLKN
jgi:hypothetical protein